MKHDEAAVKRFASLYTFIQILHAVIILLGGILRNSNLLMIGCALSLLSCIGIQLFLGTKNRRKAQLILPCLALASLIATACLRTLLPDWPFLYVPFLGLVLLTFLSR